MWVGERDWAVYGWGLEQGTTEELEAHWRPPTSGGLGGMGADLSVGIH